MTITETNGSLADYVACLKRGETMMQEHKFDDAISAFAEAISIRPEMYEGHLRLGSAYMCKDDLQSAMRSYRDAHAKQPHEMEPLLRVSEICFRTQDYENAAAVLTEMLMINDQYVPALCILPEILLKINRPDDAINLLKAALAAHPQIAELWTAAGITAQNLGKMAEAETFYKEALSLNPQTTVAQHNLDLINNQDASVESQIPHVKMSTAKH